MSDIQSTTTSIARKKAADKHCFGDDKDGINCEGKKIAASNWSKHIKMHNDGAGF